MKIYTKKELDNEFGQLSIWSDNHFDAYLSESLIYINGIDIIDDLINKSKNKAEEQEVFFLPREKCVEVQFFIDYKTKRIALEHDKINFWNIESLESIRQNTDSVILEKTLSNPRSEKMSDFINVIANAGNLVLNKLTKNFHSLLLIGYKTNDNEDALALFGVKETEVYAVNKFFQLSLNPEMLNEMGTESIKSPKISNAIEEDSFFNWGCAVQVIITLLMFLVFYRGCIAGGDEETVSQSKTKDEPKQEQIVEQESNDNKINLEEYEDVVQLATDIWFEDGVLIPSEYFTPNDEKIKVLISDNQKQLLQFSVYENGKLKNYETRSNTKFNHRKVEPYGNYELTSAYMYDEGSNKYLVQMLIYKKDEVYIDSNGRVMGAPARCFIYLYGDKWKRGYEFQLMLNR